MSWREALDAALDDAPSGEVRVHQGEAWAEVDVQQVDAIGVRVGRVRLHRGEDRDVATEAARLPGALRSVPDAIIPTEVDPGLGGAVLRSRPEHIRDREYFEVTVDGARDVDVRKVVVDGDGERSDAPWDVTREQLGRLLGELEG